LIGGYLQLKSWQEDFMSPMILIIWKADARCRLWREPDVHIAILPSEKQLAGIAVFMRSESCDSICSYDNRQIKSELVQIMLMRDGGSYFFPQANFRTISYTLSGGTTSHSSNSKFSLLITSPPAIFSEKEYKASVLDLASSQANS